MKQRLLHQICDRAKAGKICLYKHRYMVQSSQVKLAQFLLLGLCAYLSVFLKTDFPNINLTWVRKLLSDHYFKPGKSITLVFFILQQQFLLLLLLKPFNRTVPIFYLTSLFTWWPHSRVSMVWHKDSAAQCTSKTGFV